MVPPAHPSPSVVYSPPFMQGAEREDADDSLIPIHSEGSSLNASGLPHTEIDEDDTPNEQESAAPGSLMVPFARPHPPVAQSAAFLQVSGSEGGDDESSPGISSSPQPGPNFTISDDESAAWAHSPLNPIHSEGSFSNASAAGLAVAVDSTLSCADSLPGQYCADPQPTSTALVPVVHSVIIYNNSSASFSAQGFLDQVPCPFRLKVSLRNHPKPTILLRRLRLKVCSTNYPKRNRQPCLAPRFGSMVLYQACLFRTFPVISGKQNHPPGATTPTNMSTPLHSKILG
ncbi:hypothetical protein M413DRAFT_348834 [Hebeloma cylindrosporum]|uniref:Uncharacterized protein n=1 Tax=Hebeloma cylindrosporum TaxID=76867 RepID=A0A0C2XC04_HEBCY|nr:hypothetical protein M413DRAFT_348834 [Hebeloma cylindrosporum h7]